MENIRSKNSGKKDEILANEPSTFNFDLNVFRNAVHGLKPSPVKRRKHTDLSSSPETKQVPLVKSCTIQSLEKSRKQAVSALKLIEKSRMTISSQKNHKKLFTCEKCAHQPITTYPLEKSTEREFSVLPASYNFSDTCLVQHGKFIPFVTCFVCSKSWHIDCVEPPLASVPRSRFWYCSEHSKAEVPSYFLSQSLKIRKDQNILENEAYDTPLPEMGNTPVLEKTDPDPPKFKSKKPRTLRRAKNLLAERLGPRSISPKLISKNSVYSEGLTVSEKTDRSRAILDVIGPGTTCAEIKTERNNDDATLELEIINYLAERKSRGIKILSHELDQPGGDDQEFKNLLNQVKTNLSRQTSPVPSASIIGITPMTESYNEENSIKDAINLLYFAGDMIVTEHKKNKKILREKKSGVVDLTAATSQNQTQPSNPVQLSPNVTMTASTAGTPIKVPKKKSSKSSKNKEPKQPKEELEPTANKIVKSTLQPTISTINGFSVSSASEYLTKNSLTKIVKIINHFDEKTVKIMAAQFLIKQLKLEMPDVEVKKELKKEEKRKPTLMDTLCRLQGEVTEKIKDFSVCFFNVLEKNVSI